MSGLTPERTPIPRADLFKCPHSHNILYQDQAGVEQTAGPDEFPVEWIGGEFQGVKLTVPNSVNSAASVRMRVDAPWVYPKQGHLVFRLKGKEGDPNLVLGVRPEANINQSTASLEVVEGWKTYVFKWRNLKEEDFTDWGLTGGGALLGQVSSSISVDTETPRYLIGAYISVAPWDDDQDLFDMQDFNSLMNSGVW